MFARRTDDIFDPSLMEALLALTPVQRIARHDQARALVVALQDAGRRHRESEPRPAPATDPRER